MTIATDITPDRFHNMTPQALADLIGQLDREAKNTANDLEAAKNAFKSLGLTTAEGNMFAVAVSKSIRTTLDTSKVKTEMGQTWYDDHCKMAEIASLKIMAK